MTTSLPSLAELLASIKRPDVVLELTGQVVTTGGFTGRFRARLDPADRMAIAWETPGFAYRAGFDERMAWDEFGAVRVLDAAEAGRLRRVMRLHPAMTEPGRDWRVAGDSGSDPDGRSYVLVDASGAREDLVIDAATARPVLWRWSERCPEGHRTVTIRYGRWRETDGTPFPHRIEVDDPDLPFALDVEAWRPDPARESERFWAPPNADQLHRPPAIVLTTVPRAPIAEPEDPLGGVWVRHWGIPNTPFERWLVHVVVTEAAGRPVDPLRARIELFAGDELIKTEELGPAALAAARRFPVARFHPVAERFHLRHWFSEPMGLEVDRIRYTLVSRCEGATLEAAATVPIRRPAPRTRLRFPVVGRFLIVVGHDRTERSHVYERSQRFALDVIPLDDEDRPLVGDRYVDRAHPAMVVRAPAPGRVIRVRDDVPDELGYAEYLRLPDPLMAIGGNGVVIDHEDGEYSVLFHLEHRSVAVRLGDRVEAGQPLGRIGESGIPGFPHLHYHLQDGPDWLAADGLPARFTNVTLTRSLMAPLLPGVAVPRPMRGFFLQAHDEVPTS